MNLDLPNSKSKPRGQPQVREYRDAKTYFGDYYNFRRSRDPQFSYALWGDELGFKSRSFLRMICTGERVMTKKFLQKFSDRIGLSPTDREHLSLISLYAGTKDETQKKLYLGGILNRMVAQDRPKIIDGPDAFLSSLHVPVIFLLLSFKDAGFTQEALMNHLDISENELSKNLEILNDLDLIEMDVTTTRWKSKAAAFRIPKGKADPAILNFHRQSLEEAKARLDGEASATCYRSFYVPVKRADYAEFSNEIEHSLTE